MQADAIHLPFRDASFDFVLADPPYSEHHAQDLYAVPLVSVPKLLREAARVVRPGGLVGVLDLRSWYPGPLMRWHSLVAVYTANRGPKPLRAFGVYRRLEAPLSAYAEEVRA